MEYEPDCNKFLEKLSVIKEEESVRMQLANQFTLQEQPKKVTRRNPEVVRLAKLFIQRRLKPKEAISEFRKSGYSVSDKQYQRIKEDIKNDQIVKYDKLEQRGPYTLDLVENVELVKSIMFETLHSTKDNWQKIKAATIILQCIALQAKVSFFPRPF